MEPGSMQVEHKSNSRLLYPERPLQVLPLLATRIGLNEAIVIQQLHYWLSEPKVGKVIGDRKWVYISQVEWKEQCPFWGATTIRRVLDGLISKGIIEADYHNSSPLFHTKWYTIDYKKLDEFQRPRNANRADANKFKKKAAPPLPNMDNDSIKSKPSLSNMDNSVVQHGQMHSSNMDRTIPEITSETTSKKEEDIAPATQVAPPIPETENSNPAIQEKALEASPPVPPPPPFANSAACTAWVPVAVQFGVR